MKAILTLICALALVGCGARSQLQVIADTGAAAKAATTMPDGPARAALFEAIGRSVVAAQERLHQLGHDRSRVIDHTSEPP